MAQILFDDSLPQLVATLTSLAGPDFVEAGTALRDASGRLSFVADRAPRDGDERKMLSRALIERESRKSPMTTSGEKRSSAG